MKPQSPKSGSGAFPAVLLTIAIIVPTLLVYSPVIDFDFINLDDMQYVVRNPRVQGGLTGANVRWAFTTLECANWHPLTWLSLQLDRDIYRGVRPGLFHLTNLVLHLVNTALLLHVLRLLTGAVWRSAFVAALFALHPLHVESVAWVSERKDVLSTLFWLLTMWAYVAYVERPGWGRYGLVLLSFGLGLMAKPMLVTLPFVLLLLDWWPLGRMASSPETWHTLRMDGAGMDALPHAAAPFGGPGRLSRLIVEKLPLFALSLASCLVTLYAQVQGAAVRNIAYFSFDARVLNALTAYVHYLKQTAWPVNLVIFYPHAGAEAARGAALGFGALLLGVTAAVLWLGQRRPYLAVGWFWYLGTLVPVIGLVQVGDQAWADRYTYVPSIGIFLMVAWTCGDLALAVGRRTLDAVLTAAALAAVGFFAVASFDQLTHWRDSWTIWRRVLKVSGEQSIAWDGLGMAYFDAGHYPEARGLMKRAVALQPLCSSFQNNLGVACLTLGEFNEASEHLSECVRLAPGRADAHHNLAMTYVLCPEKKLAAALTHSRQAVSLDENLAPARYLLGYLCLEHGHADEAAGHYQSAVRLDPEWPERGNRIASLMAARQNLVPAEVAFALLYVTQACQATDERRLEYLETQAAVQAVAGQFPQAAVTIRKALALPTAPADPARQRSLQERLRNYEQKETR